MLEALIAFSLIFVVLLLVANWDYQDELAEYQHACTMIEAGAWPIEVEPSCKDEKL